MGELFWAISVPEGFANAGTSGLLEESNSSKLRTPRGRSIEKVGKG
jgi:hypothetical protein